MGEVKDSSDDKDGMICGGLEQHSATWATETV